MAIEYEESVEFYKNLTILPVGIPKDKVPCKADVNMTDAELVAFYSERYADVDVAEFLMKERRERLYGLCNLLQPGEFYLDVGCANAAHMEILHQRGINGIGLDLSIPNILRGRQKYPHLKFIHGFSEAIPFKDDHFDIVILGDVIEHFRNPKVSLAECLRVARKGLALCVPIKPEVTAEHINPFSCDEILNLLKFYKLKVHFYECEGRKIGRAKAESKLEAFPWLLIRAERTEQTNTVVKEINDYTEGAEEHRRAVDEILSNDEWRQNIEHQRDETHLNRFKLLSHLIEGQKVLEIGCGNGDLSIEMAKVGFDVVGIDISGPGVSQAADLAKKDNLNTRTQFMVMDATSLEFPDNSFDSVLIPEVLEHFKDSRKILEEAVRVVRNGGRIIVSVPNGVLVPFQGHLRVFLKDTLTTELSQYAEEIKWHELPFKKWLICSFFAKKRNLDITDEPLLDIMMPTYNGRKYIKNAIKSILSQTYQNWNLVVVNDGGEDVKDILDEFQDDRIKYIVTGHKGKAHALNVGITNSNGELIGYLDDDDILYPTHLEVLIKAASEGKKDFVYSDWYEVSLDENDKEIGREFEYRQDVAPWMLIRQNYINHKCILHARSLLEKAGMYDEELDVIIDWDMIRRLAFVSKPYHVWGVTSERLRYYNKAVIENRITGMWARSPDKARRSMERIANKTMNLPAKTKELKKAVIDAMLHLSYYHSLELNNALQAKNTQISNLEAAIKDKDVHISNLDALIKDKDIHISNLVGAIRDKDANIGNLEGLLREKGAEAGGLRAGLAEKEGIVVKLNEIVSQKEAHITHLERVVREREAEAGGLRAGLAEKDQWIQEQSQQIRQKDATIQEHKKKLEQADQWLREKDQWIQEQSQQLQERDLVIQGQSQQIHEKNLFIQDQTRQIEALDGELKSIKKSRVWRTAEVFRRLVYLKLLGNFPLLQKAALTISREGFPQFLAKTKDYLRKKKSVAKTDLVENDYEKWIQKNKLTNQRIHEIQKEIVQFPYKPRISIIMPVYNVDQTWLEKAIDSVLNQLYSNWELCIADDGSSKKHIKKTLERYLKKDGRIKIKYLKKNQGISGASNEALSLATGDFIGLLDNDDELTVEALYENVKLLNQFPEADMIYSDEDKLELNGARCEPYFKPDWAPDTFLSVLYTCHFGVYRKSIVDQIGGFRKGYEGSQDSDLVLRISEKTNNIFHIPKILYHWRKILGSASVNTSGKSYAYVSARKALADYLDRNNIEGVVLDGHFVGAYMIKRAIKDMACVSIIIPFKDRVEAIKKCVNSIIEKTTYRNFEIHLINNQSEKEETFHYLDELKDHPICKLWNYDKPFNFSAINNYAVSRIDAEYVIFLNNDTEVISPDWISSMLEFAQRKDVGAVGALLYYPNDTIQHAGVILGTGGGVAGHSHKNAPRDSYGYFGRIKIVQNLSAVTAACMMTKKSVFHEVSGFDENFAHAYNDVDFCLKIREKGYLIVYTPYAEFYHHESLSRGYDDNPQKREVFKREEKEFQEKWGKVLAQGDPYYNPNLTRDKEDFSIKI